MDHINTQLAALRSCKEHLAAVTALGRASANVTRFIANLNRAYPRLNGTLPLPFDD